jgi:hypothetical protein
VDLGVFDHAVIYRDDAGTYSYAFKLDDGRGPPGQATETGRSLEHYAQRLLDECCPRGLGEIAFED